MSPKRIRIEVIQSLDFRMSEWRASPELVAYAYKLFATPQFRTLMAVLKNEAPTNYRFPPPGASADDRVCYLGRIEGYQEALTNLESLASIGPSHTRIEATFEPEKVL